MKFDIDALSGPRNDWIFAEAKQLSQLPFNDLLFLAHSITRKNFVSNSIQMSTLLSIKTGACPEDCSYCPQSIRFHTEIEKHELLDLEHVKSEANKAKSNGATRFCLGAAYRGPKDRDLEKIIEMIKYVKSINLECCATLGLLKPHQAKMLAEAGLDYYNHNVDTSKDNYQNIISTRTYDDRIDTLQEVRNSGMKVCCGGIIGMGESEDDRIQMLVELSQMEKHPESVPINNLVAVKGTPLEKLHGASELDFIKMIAITRIILPKSYVRLSAGRNKLSEAEQAMCLFAGANSIFYGEKLLTTDNPEEDKDLALLNKLGITIEAPNPNQKHMSV
jgi:biotin synthase